MRSIAHLEEFNLSLEPSIFALHEQQRAFNESFGLVVIAKMMGVNLLD
jgi:hypothetical protein